MPFLQNIKTRWQTERDRFENNRRDEIRKRIHIEADFFWKADGQPIGKYEHYRTKVLDKIIEKEIEDKITPWKFISRTITIVTILAAFATFGLGLRQRELNRFGNIKPVFEVENIDDDEFSVVNHGGVAFFSGCELPLEQNKNFIKYYPKKYSALLKHSSSFDKDNMSKYLRNNHLTFKIDEEELKKDVNKENLTQDEFKNILQDKYIICWYKDIDLNSYRVILSYINNNEEEYDGFYIQNVPDAIKYEKFSSTMPWPLLDDIIELVFPKNWYNKGIKVPDDCNLFPFLYENPQSCIKMRRCKDEMIQKLNPGIWYRLREFFLGNRTSTCE